MANPITPRIARELIQHEGIVREAYRDSEDVWTWGIGVTNASGHEVHPRYKDNPQTLRFCLQVYLELLEQRYAVAVRAAFDGHALTEEQFGAALSFHYNTGGIGRAAWVRSWKAGKVAQAKAQILNWKKPPAVLPRRRKEQALFFDGTWSAGATATEWPVRKPSYKPDFANGIAIDIRDELEDLIKD
jgi:lysozyme